MFDLEQSIAGWRKQMSDAGIADENVLDELEEHLREEIQQQLQGGLDEKAAFEIAGRQIGQTDALKAEYGKVGSIFEEGKQLLCALAGIPNYQLHTCMNNTVSNIEPRWATYLKSSAYILPAVIVWVGALVLVVPKLKEICVTSGTRFPHSIAMALNFSDFVRRHFILGVVVTLAVIVLLEWRSGSWPRYRRAVFGITAFSLNFFALLFLATMLVVAVVAGSSLAQPR